MMDGACGCEDDGASRGEGESDQTLAGDFQSRFSFGSDLHDAAFACHRRSDVEIALYVEGQALRAAQSFIERAHGAMGIDTVDAIEAGGCGSGDEQVADGSEGEMICGDAGFERGE